VAPSWAAKVRLVCRRPWIVSPGISMAALPLPWAVRKTLSFKGECPSPAGNNNDLLQTLATPVEQLRHLLAKRDADLGAAESEPDSAPTGHRPIHPPPPRAPNAIATRTPPLSVITDANAAPA
jgi:hypothetical protein